MKIFIEELSNRMAVLIRTEVYLENAAGEFVLLKDFDAYDEKEEIEKYANNIAKILNCEIVHCKAVVKR